MGFTGIKLDIHYPGYPDRRHGPGTVPGILDPNCLPGSKGGIPMIRKLSLVIPGEPMTKQSTRIFYNKHTGRIGTYTDMETRTGQNSIRTNVMAQLPSGFQVWTGPIIVTRLWYVFPYTQKSRTSQLFKLKHQEHAWKHTRPDLTDNLNKGLFDALEDLVYDNDSRIVCMMDVRKIYGPEPKTILEMELGD